MIAYPVNIITVAAAQARGVMGGPLRKIRVVAADAAHVIPVPGLPEQVVILPQSGRGITEGEPMYVYQSAMTEVKAGPVTPVISL